MPVENQVPELRHGTFKFLSVSELQPNPLNPRRLFDAKPLATLEESIRKAGILVPLTVYEERKTGHHFILDGERRWVCAQRIESDPKAPSRVRIPVNVVDPPSDVANILWMFNIHNLREQWELMPTALSLERLMKEMKEDSDEKVSEVTKLSLPNVRRCKILLSYKRKYQEMMLTIDPGERIPANFFIELNGVLLLYDKLPKACSGGLERDALVDHFLELYREGKVKSVIHFRRILEAYDIVRDNQRKFESFKSAMRSLATKPDASIRSLFDPLVIEDKSVMKAEELCRDFLRKLKSLPIEHKQGSRLAKALSDVKTYVQDLLESMKG